MDHYEKIASWIKSSEKIVFLTGAGISTDSGIPDWRSNSGLYSNHCNETYVSRGYFERKPKEFWRKFKEIFEMKLIGNYKPNKGHNFLFELERMGKDVIILTQNIDGLHQEAGNTKVVELHGTLKTATCPKCKTAYDMDYILENSIPRCERKTAKGVCNFILKTDVVLFGDMLREFKQAEKALDDADLFLVLGTSLQVNPVNTLPRYYNYVFINGDDQEYKMALINRESTIKDKEFPLIVHNDISSTVEEIKKYL